MKYLDAISDCILILMAIASGMLVGGGLVTQYMIKNAVCSDRACMLLFDKSRPVDYRKF